MKDTLRICHLYGNLLNTYGDNGNLLMLQYHARQQGFKVDTKLVSIGDEFDPTAYDIIFFGGGQDFEQKVIAKDIQRLKVPLTTFIESGGVVLAICGGYQLLGQYYVDAKGEKIQGLGILSHYTERQINSRFVGDIEIYDEVNQQHYYGFENHNGVTYLGPDQQPLGRVISGHGNNNQDKTEGVRYKQVFCSYFHGPLLVRNQSLAQHLVTLAMQK